MIRNMNRHIRIAGRPSVADMARVHCQTLADAAERLGPHRLWPAQLDLATAALPDPAAPSPFASRCYRAIAAPGGSNLYWDLPLLVAAHRLGGAASAAADAYVRSWLRLGTCPNGLLRWGNHYYWDFASSAMVGFVGGEPPRPSLPDDGCLYHELRPLPVAWGVIARVDATAADRALRACRRHIVGDDGSFDRHATVAPVAGNQHAFLESGAILALGWAASGDAGLAADARRVIAFSASRRGSSGLLRNSPTLDRWDMHASTSELGMWAGAVARCGELLGDPALIGLAADALALWLDLAWDAGAGRYRGRLDVDSGAHLLAARTTAWQPGTWCDAWDPRFPAHDYPMACAEACLLLHRLTGRDEFRRGARRWVEHLAAQGDPVQETAAGTVVPGTCAELYGRAIHFLAGAGETERAASLAERAIGELWSGRMFRGRSGDDRCLAVDGVGILILALLRLEDGADRQLLGFSW